MNRRLNHFLVGQVLLRVLNFILKITGLIRYYLVRLGWIVFAGLVIEFIFAYVSGKDIMGYFDQPFHTGGLIGLAIITLYCVSEPKLTTLFQALYDRLYQTDSDDSPTPPQ